MTRIEERLSAFLDGELPDAEAREIERALASDPALRAELEALMAGDKLGREAFDALLDEPVPLHLATAIRTAPDRAAANTGTRPGARGSLAAIAASLALLVGGVGGYVAGISQPTEVAAARGWLDDIADYHRVYAAQGRHLVEVGAEEADHIETWLSASVGADVRIADLSAHGLAFQGARLLVAAGKPVAQLMYKSGDGRIVALCLIRSDSPPDGFAERTIGEFDMVTWGGGNATYVIVGDTGSDGLEEIARTAATQV